MWILDLLPWRGTSFYWTAYKAVNYESKFLQEDAFSCYGYFTSEGVSWLCQKKEMLENVFSVLKDGFVFNYPCCKIQWDLSAFIFFFLVQIKFSAFQHFFSPLQLFPIWTVIYYFFTTFHAAKWKSRCLMVKTPKRNLILFSG